MFSRVLAADPSVDKDLLMKDMIIFYFAGHDTSSHGIFSIIFYMIKHRNVLKNVFEEIQEIFGNPKPNEISSLLTLERLDNLDYLSYVIKETLRYDNPASILLGYKAITEVTLCGVPIPKDSKIFVSINAVQYNPTEWKEPNKYIPERFGPESEYFVRPGGEQKGLNSFIPFSLGLRNCAGKSLVILEMKTVVSYFLMKFGDSRL